MKKIVIAVIAVLVIVCVGAFAYCKVNSPKSEHDGITGIITFEKLSKSPIGYGVEFNEGEVPFNVELTKGTLHLEVLREGNTIYEEDFDSSKSVIVNIPEAGMYLIQISGNKAYGKINYQVSDIEETNVTADEIIELTENANVAPAKEAVLKFLKETFVEDVKEVKIVDFKLYTTSEMEENELLKEALVEGKTAFEVSYELELVDGADGMQYTAATGQVEGNIVKDKSNVGYLIEKNGKFEVEKESFGTGF